MRMVYGDPPPVAESDLVVESDEWSPGCPPGQRHRLPMQPLLWLVLVGPSHNGQRGKAEPRRDDLVRLVHPCRRPDQLALQGAQPASIRRLKPVQQRIAGYVRRPGRVALVS